MDINFEAFNATLCSVICDFQTYHTYESLDYIKACIKICDKYGYSYEQVPMQGPARMIIQDESFDHDEF